MKELGRLLREKREALGLNLDELQTLTKIRKRYLEAVEEGNWSILPGDVYARGFVRSYAESVGLDGKVLLDKYLNQGSQDISAEDLSVSESTPPSVAEKAERSPADVSKRTSVPPHAAPKSPVNPPIRSRQTRSRRGSGPAGQAAAVIAVLVVLGGAWWFLGNHHASGIANTPNASVPGGNHVGTATTGGTENSSSGPVTNNPSNTATTTPVTPAKPPIQVVAQPFQGSTQTYSVTTSQPMAVVLTAVTGDCWVKVTSDGSVIDGSDTVTKGQTRTWQANQSLTIRVGSVPSVTLSINGQQVTLPSTNNPIDVQFVKSHA
jgi:cytoskeleton protein RodZ